MQHATGEYASEQPVDLSYVTKGRGIPKAPLTLAEDKLWVAPLPSCSSLPPLPRAEAINGEDYLGAWVAGDCVALWRCGACALWPPASPLRDRYHARTHTHAHTHTLRL